MWRPRDGLWGGAEDRRTIVEEAVVSTAEALASILPPEALTPDTRRQPALGRPPEAVVRPADAEEVSRVMAWATREGLGVLPVSSGARARRVGRDGRYVALDTRRLSGIEAYEAADLTLTAGAGTPFSSVADALAEHRQWAPFDPPHVAGRSLGGLVALGESGPLRMGYGELRNHVLGCTVVTGDGRILRLGGRVVKNVAGFDVLKAVVGSRGTLAVVTSVTLRAFPVPPVDRVLGRFAPSVEALLDHALQVGRAPVLPVSCVVVDGVGSPEGDAALVVRLHGARATVDVDQRRLEDHLGGPMEALDAAEWSHVPDHADDLDVVVEASCRPSRLATVLAALRALGPESVFVDGYAAMIRLGLSHTTADALGEAREAVEGAGGALRVRSRRVDPGLEAAGSRPTGGEERLVHRLREAFDPGGVLWPARR